MGAEPRIEVIRVMPLLTELEWEPRQILHNQGFV
jgi:hypothetical protein